MPIQKPENQTVLLKHTIEKGAYAMEALGMLKHVKDTKRSAGRLSSASLLAEAKQSHRDVTDHFLPDSRKTDEACIAASLKAFEKFGK